MTKIDDLIAAGNSMPPDTMKYRGLAKNVELSNWLAFGDELVTAAYIKDMGDGDFFVQAANAREDIKAMRDENKRLSNLVHEMEEQNMRQAITTHSYEPEEAKKMTEIEIVLERLSDMARDHYIRDPQSTRDAMADIQIIRNALKGHARTMLKVEIAPGIEVFMTANQKADWEKLK